MLGDGFMLGADYFDRHDGLHFDYDAMRMGSPVIMSLTRKRSGEIQLVEETPLL